MENHQHQHLSDEINIHILSRLPADSIIRFKRVCKAWRSIIEEDPVFHDMHEHHQVLIDSTASSLGFVALESVMQGFSSSTHYVRFAEYKHIDDDDREVVMNMNRIKRWKLPFREYYNTPINPEDHPPINLEEKNKLAIVGSCNGLVCLSTTHSYKPNHHTYVCNPWTGDQVLDISDSLCNDDIDNVILVGIGFGYLLSTNEYKVVRIYASSNDTSRSIKHVQVYTLRSRSHRRHREESGRWRTIPPISSSSRSWSDISFVSRPRNLSPLFEYPVFKLGVALNGGLYFNNYRNIVLFDLANEEFRIIVAPPAVPDREIDGLGVLGGSLCATKRRHLINPINDHSNRTTDVWVMEKDNNKEEEESWIKKFSLPVSQKKYQRFSSYVPLGALASPPRILLHPNYVERKEQIVSYNPETGDSYCRDIPGYWNLSDTPIPYFKSLVSLGQSHRLTFSDINRITVLLKTD